MQGICFSCGEKTSVKKVTRCKKCYTLQTRERYKNKNAKRDYTILLQISRGESTAAEMARKYDLSREAVRLLLVKNGLQYKKAKKKISKIRAVEKERLDAENRIKYCLWCKKVFIKKKETQRFKYCSDECYEEKHRADQRIRVREYYKRKRLGLSLSLY